ncbi:MAG: hypothetical protein CMI13_09450 [Oleibacter sp.]|nr:hypothetical protein [Thalassolituus sp.]
MKEHDPYLTLLCSLPGFDALFAHKIAPLSRLRLDQHLLQLSEEHRTQLQAVEQILSFSRWPADTSSDLAQSRIQSLLTAVCDPRAKQLTEDMLDLYAVNNALTLRHSREEYASQPPRFIWCHSRFRKQIEQHWQDADFGLGHYFRWITDVSEALQQNQLLAAQKKFSASVWAHLLRQRPEDEFGFFAVVIYVLKWTYADHWSRAGSEQAGQRFAQLVNSYQKNQPGAVSSTFQQELSA